MRRKQSHKRANRYDVSGNPEAQYMDRDEFILVNKLGIIDLNTLQLLEEERLAQAYEYLLGEVRAYTPMTSELLLYIHQRIFGDLYEWAGRWRTVTISKPGAVWPPPDFLEQAMKEFDRDVLRRCTADRLHDDKDFGRAAAQIQGEFLAIHPFREGNARTIKLLTDLLASQIGRPLLKYDMSPGGRKRYIEAAKAALNEKNYLPLEQLIRRALDASM